MTVTLVRNQAPTITASDGNLGSVLATLGEGTFTYTGVLPTTQDGLRQLFGITESDPDGDPVEISVSRSSATFTGLGPQEQEVTLTVTDDPSSRNPSADEVLNAKTASVVVKLKATLGLNTEVLSPLHPTEVRQVRRGSTVPVKFRFRDANGTVITSSNVSSAFTPEIDLKLVSSVSPSDVPTIADSGNSGSSGSLFRYSSTDEIWIYNLQTNSSYVIGSTYKVSAKLGDFELGTGHISIRR